MPPHHRHPEALTGESHPLQQRLQRIGTTTPDTVDQRQRSTAHRRDVAQIHQHTAPAGKPRVLLHQPRMHALTGQQQLAVLARQQSGIVPQHPRCTKLRERLVAKHPGRWLNVAFGQQTAVQPQSIHQLGKAHAARDGRSEHDGRRSRDGA